MQISLRHYCAVLKVLLAVTYLCFVSAAVKAQTSADVAASKFSELRSNIRSGTLSNGFRYAILPTANKGDTISLLLSVSAGFVDAAPGRLQAPHVLEHVLVRGFRTPSGGYVSRDELQRSWGAQVDSLSASTTATDTTFRFETPEYDFDRTLLFVRGIANGQALDADDIRLETKISLAEMLRRYDPRSTRYLIAKNFGSQSGGDGDEAIHSLKNIEPSDVTEFYQEYYKANRQTLYIVGHVDAAEVEDSIAAIFGDIPGAAPRQMSLLSQRDISDGPVVREPNIGVATANILLGYGGMDRPPTAEEKATREVLVYLLREEIDRRTKLPGSVLRRTEVRSGTHTWDQRPGGVDIEFSARPGFFVAAATELFGALKTVATFDDDRIGRAKASVAQYSQESSEAKCLQVDNLLYALLAASKRGRLGDLYCGEEVTKGQIASVTSLAVKAEISRFLDRRRIAFFAIAPEIDRDTSVANMRQALAKSHADRTPSKLEPALAPADALGSLTPPPVVGERAFGEGIVRLDNYGPAQAIIVDRRTPDADFAIRLYGSSPAIVPVALQKFGKQGSQLAKSSGFGGLTARELERYLETLGLRFDVQLGPDRSIIEVNGPPTRFREGLNLLFLLLRGPDLRSAAILDFRTEVGLNEVSDQQIFADLSEKATLGADLPSTWSEASSAAKETPSGPEMRQLWSQLFGDPKQWIVIGGGKIDERAFAAGIAGMGASISRSHFTPAERVEYGVSGRAQNGIVLSRGHGLESRVRVIVPLTLGAGDNRDGLILALAGALGGRSRIYSRLRVIEAGAYSPATSVYRNSRDKHGLYMMVDFVCDPGDTDRLVEAIWDEISNIQNRGFSADELRRIKALQPVKVPVTADAIADAVLGGQDTVKSRVVNPSNVDSMLSVVRAINRDDLIVIEAKP